MQVQTLDISNNGAAAFQLGPVSIPAGESFRLFDLADLSSYDLALWVMVYGIDPVYDADRAGDITVSLNGSDLDDQTWAAFRDWIAALFAGQLIGFHGQPFVFDMKKKTLRVSDPLSGDLYEVQLSKVQ